jgi:GT2 family glycosyltransferase
MSKVKIITVHYGKIKTTLNCLSSLSHLTNLSDLILINNSQSNIDKTIKKKIKQVSIINNPQNLGYPAALNIGIKLALKNNPQFILIINNDVIVKKNFLKELLSFSKKQRADLISPKILDQNSKIWFDGGEIDKNRYTAGHKKGKTDFLSGCCLLIRKKVFDKIGFFDEDYFMYYEDVDFCLRARKAGFKLGIVDKAIVYHHIKRSAKGIKLMDYYLARNHLLFVKKHGPLFVKIRELIRLPKTLWEHWRKKEFSALHGIKDCLLRRQSLYKSVLQDGIFIFLCFHVALSPHFCCL